MARAAFGGIAEFRKWAASHCDVARILGARMGLSGPVQQSLRHLYERWDGNGMPGELRGTQIPLAVRLMQVAQDADVAGLAPSEVVTLRRAALVHDIGRVAVPVSVCAKPGPLTPRRARAGAAARLPQRAGARRLPGAAPAGPAGRIPRRAVRRVRLPPGQPGRRPARRGLAAGGGGLLPGDAGTAGAPPGTVTAGCGRRAVPGGAGGQAPARGGTGGTGRGGPAAPGQYPYPGPPGCPSASARCSD